MRESAARRDVPPGRSTGVFHPCLTCGCSKRHRPLRPRSSAPRRLNRGTGHCGCGLRVVRQERRRDFADRAWFHPESDRRLESLIERRVPSERRIGGSVAMHDNPRRIGQNSATTRTCIRSPNAATVCNHLSPSICECLVYLWRVPTDPPPRCFRPRPATGQDLRCCSTRFDPSSAGIQRPPSPSSEVSESGVPVGSSHRFVHRLSGYPACGGR